MQTLSPVLLYSLVTFADSKNIVEAAQHLGVSQPALTAHLKKIESLLPHPIFTFQGRKKVLTAYGLEVCRALRDKFFPFEQVIQQVSNRFSAPENASLQIGGRVEILRRTLRNFHFEGRLSFIPMNHIDAMKALSERKIDICISTEKMDDLNFFAQKLFSDHYVVLTPTSWGMKEGTLRKSDLLELIERPYLTYKEKTDPLRRILSDYKIEEQVIPRVIFEDWECLVELIGKGRGWSVVPSSFIKGSQVHAMKISSAEWGKSDFYLIYSKDYKNFSWFKELAEKIKVACQI